LLSSAFALVYGPPACGKSFLVTDLLLTLAWATVDPKQAGEWFGHRIRKPAGVVYIASESPEDFEVRLHAWRMRNELAANVELPFVFLPTTIDMANGPAETKRLVEELRRIDVYFKVKFGVGVGVVAVDTVSRALAGGNENAPDVMGSFIKNCEALRDGANKTAIIAVHHSPIDGSRPRGHTSCTAPPI
jgi:RecA-family ATPase